jgi:hypothetical protein
MPGLELIGTLALTTKTPARDELQRGVEECSLVVAGDCRAVPYYSGNEIGARWLCRIQGPAAELINDWPTEDGDTYGYFATEQEARQMYNALKAHLPTRMPGVRFVDTRHDNPLNMPTALSESAWQDTTEVARLVLDRMTDLQVVMRNTDVLWTFPANVAQPEGLDLVSYSTQTDVLYVAIARGASGAAEHLAVIYSPRHQPQPMISQGFPGADEDEDYETDAVTFPSNIAVVFWGIAGGHQVLAPARGGDPAAMLHAYMGANIAVPLASNAGDLDQRLGGIAPAYAVRMEPGEYCAHFYMLDPRPGEGYSMMVLSREGAPSFQPAGPEKTSRVRGGLSLDQYAMVAAERDRILMTQGQNAGAALMQLCQRYGIQHQGHPMTAGRVPEWDQLINGGDPELSAQWATQYAMANAKLNGVQMAPEQLAQVAQHQQMVQAQLQQHGQAHRAAGEAIRNGALQLIEMARTQAPPQLVESAKRLVQDPAEALRTAIVILKNPGEKGNPRVQGVDQIADKLARAHWAAMSQEDRDFEGGKEKDYVKENVNDIYEANGIKTGGFFSRLVDKL